MPTKIHNTGITFPDATIQTTAATGGGVTSLNGQTGAIDNTTQYAIGSYVIGRPLNITNYNNSTVAGSILYATTTNGNVGTNEQGQQTWGNTQLVSLVNTGSWRCVSISSGISGQSNAFPGLWVRYA